MTGRTAIVALALAVSAGCDAFESGVWPTTLPAEPTVTAAGAGPEWGPELFPHAPGDRWVYVSAAGWTQLGVSDRTTPLNGDTAEIWEEVGLQWPTQRWLQVDSGAVRDYGESAAFNPCSVPRLVFPVRVGQRWELDCGVGELTSSAQVEAAEPVDTPLGRVDAVRVRYEVVRRGVGSAETWWFAPDLGVVARQAGSALWLLRHAEVAGR